MAVLHPDISWLKQSKAATTNYRNGLCFFFNPLIFFPMQSAMLIDPMQRRTTYYARPNLLVGANAVPGHPLVELQVCDSNFKLFHPNQQQAFPWPASAPGAGPNLLVAGVGKVASFTLDHNRFIS